MNSVKKAHIVHFIALPIQFYTSKW